MVTTGQRGPVGCSFGGVDWRCVAAFCVAAKLCSCKVVHAITLWRRASSSERSSRLRCPSPLLPSIFLSPGCCECQQAVRGVLETPGSGKEEARGRDWTRRGRLVGLGGLLFVALLLLICLLLCKEVVV